MRIDKTRQGEGTKCLTDVTLAARCVVCPMMDPFTFMGPHHRVIVCMVFTGMIRIRDIKRVAVSCLKRPLAVGIVVVIVSTTRDVGRSIVNHGERIEISLACAFGRLSVAN